MRTERHNLRLTPETWTISEMKNVAILLCAATLTAAMSQRSAQAQDSAAQTIARSLQSVGRCQFRIANMFGGEFEVPQEHNESVSQQGIYYFTEIGPKAPRVLRSFSLNCLSATDQDIGIALGASHSHDRWMRYDLSLGDPALTPFEKSANPQTVALKGTNWTGIGLTVDATTGDEETRARSFSFCLIHNEQALCGNTPVAWLANPIHNDLWMVKSILRSVVFSDAPTPASVSASSSERRSAKSRANSE
jgi:hypothetical protein